MSIDFSLVQMAETPIFESNITHNLTQMADAAGLYIPLWHPEQCEVRYAKDLIPMLKRGLIELKARPDHYRQFDAKNGWGTYDQFVPWVQNILVACQLNPEAMVRVSI